MAQSSSEHGNFYWNELATRDVEKAKKFYGETIGWTFEGMPMPDGTYWVAKMGGKAIGGLFPISGAQWQGVPEHWMSYLAVDDVESCLWIAAKHSFALPEEYRVPDVKRACRFDFDRAMSTLSVRLGSRGSVMGGDFTVPDLLLGHCAGWAQTIGWTIPGGNVSDYIARIRGRSAFIKTMKAREAA